jgi:diaminopimelate epimerase
VDELRFWKYHGTGNDFVMLEDVRDEMRISPELVSRLCDRRLGVGADGLIRVAPAESADFFMDYMNADGSLAEMCGNGIRCLGKLVYERGLTKKTELDVETRAGVKHISLHVEGADVTSVTVGMGPPAFSRKAIPMSGPADDTFLRKPFEVDGGRFEATAVSMGNPHVVLFLDRAPDPDEVHRVGPLVETHELFPERTNVEFVTRDGEGIAVRVWERGVGETMACGTGACAAVVAANEAGWVGRVARARFPGGVLDVERRDDDVLLTGPAERVFEGVADPAWLEAAR